MNERYDDYEQCCADACYASMGKRFLTNFIDGIILGIIQIPILFTAGMLGGFLIFAATGDITSIDAPESDLIFNIIGAILGNIVLFVYYVFFEKLYGRSIGKMICGVQVVDKDGNLPSFGRICLRTICRLIPFDAVSFLFAEWDRDGLTGAWHDSLSKTYVVDTKQLKAWKAEHAESAAPASAIDSI